MSYLLRKVVRNKFRDSGSRQFVQKIFGYANRLFSQLSGWLVSDDLGGEDAGCGGPGLVWLHVVCGCEAGWMYSQKKKNLHNMSLAELYFILSGKNEINSAQKRERRMTAYFLILISYLI